MATTAWLYATTASGPTTASNATGAPNGTEAGPLDLNSSPLTTGGFGVQAALGGVAPTSITAVRVRVRMRQTGGYMATGDLKANGLDVAIDNFEPSDSLTDYTWTLPAGASTWAALGSLSITNSYNNTGSARYVDSVGVQVEYTEAVPITLPPIAGEGRVTLAAANLHAVVLPILGEGVITLAATYLPVGFVSLPIVGEGTVRLTATNLHAVVLPPVEGEGRTRLAAQRLKPTIIRRPPRTVEELIRGSHRRTDHALILTGEHAGERLPLVGGDLTLDDTADIHATGTLQLPPEPWLRDLLDPVRARTELQVVLAIRGDDGTLHTWPKAVVHPTEEPIEVSADGGLSLSVKVADRSDWVKKAGMRGPYAGLGSLSILTHALRLIAGRAPWLPVGDIDDPGYRSGTDLLVGGLGDDPWQHAVQLAWSVGRRLYVDADGRLATRSMLTAGSAEARWVSGEADCLVSSMSTSRSDADLCNALGVPWEEAKPEDADDTWVAKSGVVWWEDLTSTLGINGTLGERARGYTGDTSIVHSPAHALDLAVSHGIAQQGVLAPLDFVVGCDPRLSVGSTVAVRRPELDVDALCRIGVLRYELASPLMAGSMTERRLLA